jgi:hypothetical protein
MSISIKKISRIVKSKNIRIKSISRNMTSMSIIIKKMAGEDNREICGLKEAKEQEAVKPRHRRPEGR